MIVNNMNVKIAIKWIPNRVSANESKYHFV